MVLLAFGSAAEAEPALGAVSALERGDDPPVQDAAVVVRTAVGRVELHQTKELAPAEGAVAGGTAALVAGLLIGFPVAGAVAGIVGGGAFGLRDTGIPDDRLRKLGRDLEPGHAVLCVLVAPGGLPRVRDVLAGYGEVLEAELEEAAEP
jgi:uncharacterized membrane protein